MLLFTAIPAPSADTLKPGDRVIITGAPGRNASERRIHLKSIERPADGWAWRGGADRGISLTLTVALSYQLSAALERLWLRADS
jgi:hypothetical protein